MNPVDIGYLVFAVCTIVFGATLIFALNSAYNTINNLKTLNNERHESIHKLVWDNVYLTGVLRDRGYNWLEFAHALPEEDRRLIVTFKKSDGIRILCDSYRLRDSFGSLVLVDDVTKHRISLNETSPKPVAWMYYPDAYKEVQMC